MAERIPDEWKLAVLAILNDGDPDRIEVRQTTALIPFGDLFLGAFAYELLNAFEDGLTDEDLEGRRIYDMEEAGETWAFIFTHRKKKIYGKLCLTPDNELIIIYSAHAPHKGDKI
ncbi:MAG: hypothetical protein HQ523_06240 [Lentisphaerae bacterium]|nr:hypothetical protein [Lentisphaerota bacterium]